ncbi:MAG: Tol-Pal system beta propeller repeat protein TolB [Smithellaceae bacterium]
MKHLSIWTLFIILPALLATADLARASKIYIDIDSPGFRQFPIAVSDFTQKADRQAKTADLSVALPEQIRKLLGITGLFNPLDKNSFLDESGVSLPESIRFSDWTAIGADYLLTGLITTVSPQETACEIRLYDVVRGSTLLYKRYISKTPDLRALARATTTDILLTLTGDAGDFNTRIAFVSKNGSEADIHTISYDGEDTARLTRHQSIIAAPRWSPDGRYLAFTSYQSGRPAVYLRNLKTGQERIVSSSQGLNLSGGFSPDSRKLLMTLSRDSNEEIYVLDLDTMRLKRLTYNYAIDVSPAWSPAGEKIAFVSNRSGTPQIFVMDADGNNVRRITYEGNYNTSPAWSPRGGKIAFEGLINRRFQIFTVDTEGENLTQLTFDDANNEYPSWSPSGRQIVYGSRTGAKTRLCIINSNGLHTRVLQEGNGVSVMPSWSPRMTP